MTGYENGHDLSVCSWHVLHSYHNDPTWSPDSFPVYIANTHTRIYISHTTYHRPSTNKRSSPNGTGWFHQEQRIPVTGTVLSASPCTGCLPVNTNVIRLSCSIFLVVSLTFQREVSSKALYYQGQRGVQSLRQQCRCSCVFFCLCWTPSLDVFVSNIFPSKVPENTPFQLSCIPIQCRTRERSASIALFVFNAMPTSCVRSTPILSSTILESISYT